MKRSRESLLPPSGGRRRAHKFPLHRLFGELQGEVRARCSPFAAHLLAMTCHREAAALATAALRGEDMLAAAARDGSIQLMMHLRLQDRRDFVLHKYVLHQALDARQWSLVRWLITTMPSTAYNEIRACCLRRLAPKPPAGELDVPMRLCKLLLARANALMMSSIQYKWTGSPENCLFFHAVYANNVPLLDALAAARLIEPKTRPLNTQPWIRLDDVDNPKSPPRAWLHCLDALVWVQQHAASWDGVAQRVWLALLKDAVYQGWTAEQLDLFCRQGIGGHTLFEACNFSREPHYHLVPKLPVLLVAWGAAAKNESIEAWGKSMLD